MGKMTITCSRCGKHRRFNFSVMSVARAIRDGWGSYGNVLYCPECTKTWNERNSRSLSDNFNTIRIIDDLHNDLCERKDK